MASFEAPGQLERGRRSRSLPRRKNTYSQQDDEAAGFTSPKHMREDNYNHDIRGVQLSSSIIKKDSKKLSKLQEDIRRKSKKKKSKELDQCKQEYSKTLQGMVTELKDLMSIVGERDDHGIQQEPPRGQCADCYNREKDRLRMETSNDSLTRQLERLKEAERRTRRQNEEKTRELLRQLDSVNEELAREREAKQDALTRLSAITSSRLRDNNPNLTDLSDPHRPSKIGEMFSELYDNEWTSAYDELCHSKSEVEAIQLLNELVMSAYDCCMRLSKPIRSYLDTSLIKIDSEFRQKIIGHFKQSAMVVVQDLSQILQKDVCARCNPALQDSRDFNTYIRRCIEICWLMAVQDPPMTLDNTKPDQFDTARYRGYQHNGPYTAYIVWPAIRLHNDGPLLSKGVAEGTKSLKRPIEDLTFKQTGKSRPTGDRTTKQKKSDV